MRSQAALAWLFEIKLPPEAPPNSFARNHIVGYYFPMKSERPVPLTFLCLAGFIGCLLGVFVVYSPSVQKMGMVYALFRSFGFSFLIACFYGLWTMRRWSLWALGAYFLVNQAVCLAYGTWDKGTLGPLVVLGIGLIYSRRMQ